MITSPTIEKISAAYLMAQKEIGAAVKGSVNPFFHSKYADLGAVMEACKDALNKFGISVLQPVVGDVVETILLHESGEWLSSTTKIVVKMENDPQAQGSAISYARRYGLQSMVFIPAEDDDAEAATNHKVPSGTSGAKVETAFNQSSPSMPDVTPTNLGVCKKCGAPIAVSKAGAPYCSAKCWMNKT